MTTHHQVTEEHVGMGIVYRVAAESAMRVSTSIQLY